MSRASLPRIRLVALALTFAAAFGPSSSAAKKKGGQDRELIFLILIDAVRADHVGAYGYQRPTTPTIDALAAKGTRYTRAYVNAPWTRPSTACFLTGLNASRHRTETEKSKMSESIATLAHRLNKAGWKTSGFSANGNGGSLAALDQGFDLFRDPTNTYSKKIRGKTYNGLPTGEFMTDKVLKHLKKSKAKREFVFIFYVDPHDPYYAPPALEKKFLGDFKGKIRRRALWEKNNDYSDDERYSMVAIYDAGIRYSDDSIAALLEGLDKLGLKDKATFFITADHGEGFGEHGFYLHAHHFWEEVIRVPLVAVGPRFKTAVDDRLTQSIDITASILHLADAERNALSGRSLLDPPANEHVISEYNEFGIHRQAIIGERYKVIWQRPADEAWYLRSFSDKFTVEEKKAFFPSVSFAEEVVTVFDLKNDPGEKNDLSAKMPPEAAALLKELRGFVAESQSLAARTK